MIIIPYKYIIKTKNIKLIEFCLQYLFNLFFYNTNNLIFKNHYITFNSFIPLPTTFISEPFNDIVIEENSIYLNLNNITNKNKNRILVTNRILPFYIENPIPFSFPIFYKNNYEFFNSNVFYYEITISEQLYPSWDNEAIIVGFGSVFSSRHSFPGWKNNTFGYHLDDGTYQYNENIINNFGPIGKIGDIIGAGIIYLSDITYQPFFTINGKLIETKIPEIIIEKKIVPMIGFDHSYKITFNLGKDEFKFNIKNYLHGNQIISFNNIFFEKKNQNESFNLSKKFKPFEKTDINTKNNITILSAIISELSQQQNEDLPIFNEPIFLTNQQNNFFTIN